MYKQQWLFDKPLEVGLEKAVVNPKPYTEYRVEIGGVKFGLFDLQRALEGAEDGTRYLIPGSEMCVKLKELGIIDSCGSRRNGMSASPGRRFQELFDLVNAWAEKVLDEREE